jgi:hypothetical protein
MSIDAVDPDVQENLAPSISRKLIEVVADAYSFIRSAEANAAFATVTLEALMTDQINRNGESAKSNASQYNPYAFDPSAPAPAGVMPSQPTNFLGSSDTGLPTKIDRITAIKNALTAVIQEIKLMPPVDVANAKEYTDQLTVGLPQNISGEEDATIGAGADQAELTPSA